MKTTILDHKNIGDYLNNHMNAQLLKYAAGQYIFCPNCERALHYKTVILIDVYKGSKHLGQKVGCVHCFKPTGVKEIEKQGIRLEITKFEK